MRDHKLDAPNVVMRDATSETRWARVSTFENDENTDFEAGVQVFVDHLLPLARKAPGWLGTVTLATPDRATSITISFWASKDTMDATEQLTAGSKNGPVATARDSVSAVDRYEVVLFETPR